MPAGTTTINDTAVIVVTDYLKDTLTLLGAETGRLLRTIDTEGKHPYGITVDNDDNVYVCFPDIHKICVWSNDFKENKILLSGDDLGVNPQRIVYNGVNDSLFVSSYYWNSTKGDTVAFSTIMLPCVQNPGSQGLETQLYQSVRPSRSK